MCTGVGNFVRVPSRTYDLSARHGSGPCDDGEVGVGYDGAMQLTFEVQR